MRMKSSSTHSISQLFVFAAALLCIAAQAFSLDFSEVAIGGGGAVLRRTLSFSELEAQGTLSVKSSYFDKAMGYRGSTFRTISFAKLIDRFNPGGGADAVLLNCRDDYQGVLSIEDIRRYDLRLATEIRIGSAGKKPGWLNPLLVIVPDGAGAPKMERFMAANISELLFVRLDDYYGPLAGIAENYPDINKGLTTFKDNCLFCHSIKSVGGNKGTVLLAAYDFSEGQDSARFKKDFAAFHNEGNEDKQNADQFVSRQQLKDIADFLKAAAQ